MPVFADLDIVQCVIQFVMIGLFLFVPFVSWVVKQFVAFQEQKSRKAAAQQHGWRPTDAPSQDQAMPPAAQREALARIQGDPNILDAEVVEDARKSSLSTRHLSEHAAHLGSLDDGPAEINIHDQFDYEVGRLGDSSDAVHEDPNADKLPDVAVTTGDIVEIFRSPERIREAIILNEILTRPEDRWD